MAGRISACRLIGSRVWSQFHVNPGENGNGSFVAWTVVDLRTNDTYAALV